LSAVAQESSVLVKQEAVYPEHALVGIQPDIFEPEPGVENMEVVVHHRQVGPVGKKNR